ncbi:MAG: cytochrome c family protein, partial [Pseudomonadota bacterium]
LNMIAGSVIGALLVFMLIGFFGGKIFGTRAVHHHGPEELAFAIEIEDAGEVEEDTGVDLASLVASADVAKGAKVFSKCKSCHKLDDGANGVGPHLYGVVGREIGGVGGFGYSDVLAGMSGEAWGLENLSAFLEDPKGWAPGTKMGFSGLSKPEDRVNLIVYLNEDDGSPIELAAAPAATATDATEAEPAAGEAEGTETESTEGENPATEEPAQEEAAAEEEATDEGAATEDPAQEEAADGDEAADEGAATEEPAQEEAAAEDATEEATEVAAVSTDAAEEDETTEAAAATGGGEFSELIAAVDLKKGKKVFRKCRACHKLDEGKNGVGPSLYGIVGRPIGSVDSFSYSDAMSGAGGNWTVGELMNFIQAPKSHLPGTKMAFAGVKDAQDRMNVIAYLNEEGGAPGPLE